MTDHPKATITPTTVADRADLIAELRGRRAEVERIREARARGEAGYSDLAAARCRAEIATLACRTAGLVIDGVFR